MTMAITKCIVFTLPGGAISIGHGVPSKMMPGESQDDFLARCAAKTILSYPPGTTSQLMSMSAVPFQYRKFRGAWTLNEGQLLVNMIGARSIHREYIRAARQMVLNELDIAYQRADETNDGALKAQIAQDKQALRDLPQDPAIDTATTPEALVALWPLTLPNPYTGG